MDDSPGPIYDSYAHKRPIVGGANFFNGQHIASDQVNQAELKLISRALSGVLAAKVLGDIVEFGCYIGTTSLYLRRFLDARGESDQRQLHVYDSFEGLPSKAPQDASPVGTDFTSGALAVHKKELVEQFRKANLRLPRIHKAWFTDLTEEDVPRQIAFAFLDGDFYDSIMDSLKLVWPRLSPGGVVAVDDYGREALPGVERAVRDFFKGKRAGKYREGDLVFFKKP